MGWTPSFLAGALAPARDRDQNPDRTDNKGKLKLTQKFGQNGQGLESQEVELEGNSQTFSIVAPHIFNQTSGQRQDINPATMSRPNN